MPTDYLFGPSVAHPGQPRFPFGDIRYAAAFGRHPREAALPGLYGMVWWEDDSVHQLRQHLEGIKVWDATGTTAVTLWDRTVFMFMADNGADLPHAKYSFTENGFRSPIVVYDASRPPSAADPRVDLELAGAVDIAPTVLDYAGRPIPPLPGVSLKPYVDGTPPAAPFRNTVCGNQVRGATAIHVRFIRTRPGTVGRCAPAAGGACTSDADCAGGVCLLGACATGQLCLEDDDCPGGETCGARAQKWCRFGHHPVNEASVPPPDQQPTVACDVDADCVAGCPSADSIYCTCEYRAVKLYVRADASLKLMDVFVDPDERGLARYFGAPPPGDLSVGPGAPAHHLAQRLGCCLDHWWVPPGQPGDPGCTSCEPTYECHRCGDGVADASEACDGANLRGASCTTIPGGFSGGTLACTPSCTLDTSGCTL